MTGYSAHPPKNVTLNWLRVLGHAAASHMARGISQPLPAIEVRPDQCVELRFGSVYRSGRCGRVCCTCAHGSMAAFAACEVKHLNHCSSNMTIDFITI